MDPKCVLRIAITPQATHSLANGMNHTRSGDCACACVCACVCFGDVSGRLRSIKKEEEVEEEETINKISSA